LGRFERVVARYTRLCVESPIIPLVVLTVFTALCIWRGVGIEVDPDLKALLPDDAPSVVAIEEARSRRGGSDQFVIAVTSPEPLATVQFVDALAEAFREWEEVESLDYARDQSFFRENALLYMPVSDLFMIKRSLQRMIRERLGSSHPLYEDLERRQGDAPFDWRDQSHWVSPETLVELGLEDDALDQLFPFLAEEPEEPTTEGSSGPLDVEAVQARRLRAARNALPDEYQDYRVSPSGGVAVFAANLAGRSTNLNYSDRAYAYGMDTIARLDPSSFHPDLRAQVVGGYRDFQQVDAIKKDAATATKIAIGLILLLLVGFFRNLRSIYIVLLPLLAGISWTLGSIELFYGHLNALTVFVFSMLIGMGIDFGLHIYRRTQEEWLAGRPWDVALMIAITRTGRALLTATVTTVVSLLTLLAASFDGFREFGVACGAGVALCLLATVVVMPPLVGLSEKVWPQKRPENTGVRTVTGPAWLIPAVRIASLVVLVACAMGVAKSGDVAFEYNFRNLEAPRPTDRIAYGSALGRNRSSSPAIILGQDEAQMREVHAELRERLENGDPLLRGFQTIESLVPSDQEARLEMISQIYDVLDRRAVQRIDGDEGEVIVELTELTDVDAFTIDDLPQWSTDVLREKDGSVGGMGLLYGEYEKRDARDVSAFQDAYQSITVPSGDVRVSTNGFIIADVVRYVQADGKKLALYVTLGLLIVLFFDLRSIGGVVVCLATLGSAVTLTLLGMVVFDIKIGLYNLIVLPTVLGVGIDGAVHVYHRWLEEGRTNVQGVLSTTGVAVIASSVTTMAGFVGLMFIPHLGIRTIGSLSVLGIAATLISVWTILPAMLSFAKPPAKT
jgi:predicted RND superfamily exporter protein